MKLLMMSGKRAAGTPALVDDERYDEVASVGPWWLSAQGYPVHRIPHPQGGTRTSAVDGATRQRTTTEPLHRFLCGGQQDHVDLDRLNNQISNLRPATQAQNCQNMPSRGGTSRHRGVCWNKARGKWQAQAQVGGRRRFHGFFDEEQEAATAVAEWRRLHMPFSSDALVGAP